MVAIEHLDGNGSRGNREFLVEVLMSSLLNHPSLINLVGYCTEGDERLLVQEYLPLGSLDQHLHGNCHHPIVFTFFFLYQKFNDVSDLILYCHSDFTTFLFGLGD